MKKICALLLSGLIANGFAYDLLYTLGSTDQALDGNLYLTIQNVRGERIVMNNIKLINDSGQECLLATDFIIKPNTTVMLTPFSQYKCFGLANNMVLNSAYKPTKEMFPGNVEENIRIQTHYTVGYQPDPYSTNIPYSLYFNKAN
ncbi:MAG: hypothetical protein QG673_2263 [Pseudomonadota bacterium]|nr:hypothetical protein [Pseudomonadota bacterium]